MERAYVPWTILGAGRAGKAISLLGKEVGAKVTLWNRTAFDSPHSSIRCVEGELETLFSQVGGSVVWLTVSDDAIAEVAAELVPYLKPADIVLHVSGSLDSRVLRSAGLRGPLASIHPLLSISNPKVALDAFRDCAWTIEGDFAALQFGRWVLGKIGVEPIEIKPEDKILYHAAAVMSAGHLTALMDAVFSVAESCGFSAEQARQMYLPLASSILKNLENLDTAAALTGPVARRDQKTIEGHEAALQRLEDNGVSEVYEVLLKRSRDLLNDPH